MLDFRNEQEFEKELEALVASDDKRHPIHRAILDEGVIVAGTGSTNGCVGCSPSSETRCGGGFTKCG